MKVYNNITELIGNTPLLRLNGFKKAENLQSDIFAKLEMLSAFGSLKDRTAFGMIIDAEKRGILKPGGTIIEFSAGNTGISLAYLAITRGYKLILTMVENASEEMKTLFRILGAEIVLTPLADGAKGSLQRAKEISENIPGSFFISQHTNLANVQAHYDTTGPEIWNDMDGQIDYLVLGIGAAGTLSGAGKYLKEKNPNIKIVAVEPAESAVIAGGAPGLHGIRGNGTGTIPPNLNRDLIDELATVSTDEAVEYQQKIITTEGLSAGTSSGAVLAVAIRIAKREAGKNIVIIFADNGERYLSLLASRLPTKG